MRVRARLHHAPLDLVQRFVCVAQRVVQDGNALGELEEDLAAERLPPDALAARHAARGPLRVLDETGIRKKKSYVETRVKVRVQGGHFKMNSYQQKYEL